MFSTLLHYYKDMVGAYLLQMPHPRSANAQGETYPLCLPTAFFHILANLIRVYYACFFSAIVISPKKIVQYMKKLWTNLLMCM